MTGTLISMIIFLFSLKDLKDTISKLKERAVKESAVLQRRLEKDWADIKDSLHQYKRTRMQSAIEVTDGLIAGTFSPGTKIGAMKGLETIFERGNSASETLDHIKNPEKLFKRLQQNNIYEEPHKLWPKEFDFLEMSHFISSHTEQYSKEIGTTINKWVSLIKDMATLYHFKNLEAELQLQETLQRLAHQGMA